LTYRLNDKVTQLTPYEPGTGEFSIRLDANESFLQIPEHILEEMKDNLGKIAFNRYPDPLATECLQAFANVHNLNADHVTAGNGSDELISVIVGGLFQKGDKLLLVDPDFSMYAFYAHVAELEVVRLSKSKDYIIDPEDLVETALQNNCRGILFSNPCNPTSQGMPREDLIRVLDRLPDTLVIADEAYMDFWDQSVMDLVEEYPQLLVLRTCSKAFGAAALRLGFAVAGPMITTAIRSLKSPYNVNSLTQAAAAALLRHPQCLKKGLAKILASRDELYGRLQELKDSPLNQQLKIEYLLKPKTNFVLVRFHDNVEIYDMLKDKGILVRCFPRFMRITAGSPEENRALLQTLMNYAEGLI